MNEDRFNAWDGFNAWWDSFELMEENPYSKDTAAFWAWEGWVAGVRAEREECAKVCERNAEVCNNNSMLRDVLMGSALAIRWRGE